MIPILLLLTALSVITDATTDRIPAFLPLAGILCGIALALQRAGPYGLITVLTDTLAMFIITFLLFLTHALRGGDGKLLCAISAITGLGPGCRILFMALLVSVPIGFVKKCILCRNASDGSGQSLTYIHFSIPVLVAALLFAMHG